VIEKPPAVVAEDRHVRTVDLDAVDEISGTIHYRTPALLASSSRFFCISPHAAGSVGSRSFPLGISKRGGEDR